MKPILKRYQSVIRSRVVLHLTHLTFPKAAVTRIEPIAPTFYSAKVYGLGWNFCVIELTDQQIEHLIKGGAVAFTFNHHSNFIIRKPGEE